MKALVIPYRLYMENAPASGKHHYCNRPPGYEKLRKRSEAAQGKNKVRVSTPSLSLQRMGAMRMMIF